MDYKNDTPLDYENVSFSFNPTHRHLNEIGLWLKEEELSLGEGFFCNWNAIQSSFENNRMLVLMIRDIPLGFVTWYEYDHTAEIQITEINPSLRGQGYGKIMLNVLSEYFLESDILVIKLSCQPPSSEGIWKKMGFVEFPQAETFKRYNIENDKHLYKILVKTISIPSTDQRGDETIELWDTEPIFCKDKKPNWIWSIKYFESSSRLTCPIIHVGHKDWKIRWERGGKILAEGKVKYFKQDISFGDFIIIKEIIN